MTTVFQQVGRYTIQRELGRGGMATVFLAADAETGRDVALKQVPIGFDREAQEVLEAEEFGAQLQRHFAQICDDVPKVYDCWKDGDYFYIAMEYVAGRNLSDLIAEGLPPARAVEIAIALCTFLERAHGFAAPIGLRDVTSLYHCDLKPRNVRITGEGAVRVLDFGIAKALSLSRKVTRNDFGSIAYLSPERLETEQVDASTDLWSIGVLLYEMLAGVPPFRAGDTRQLERRIRSRVPPAPLSCPPDLQAVVARLLAPDAADRYATAAAVREDLERFRSGRPTQAALDGWPARAHDEPKTVRTAAPIDEEATRRTPRATAAAVSLPPAAAAPRPAPSVPALPPPGRRRLMKPAMLLVALLLVLHEVAVGSAANRLTRSLVARQLPDLADAWTQYQDVSGRAYIGFAVLSLRGALVDRTRELSEHVMANYRSAPATVHEAQWVAADAALLHALAVDPRDRRLKADARYCEAHIHRLEGETRQAKHDTAGARQEFTEAVTAFREAAELRPAWPDPFLGLLRTFIYGLGDLDRGVDALHQAERLGFVSGNRETAQLADGYRARGERLLRSARTLRGLPQEQGTLGKAADAFRQSLELYAKIPDFANGASNMRLAQRGLDQTERRLTDITEGGPWTGAAVARH
ncbi:MAG TPA: serine/threonine-protein kinase [Vicinamibacterales bacterium]|nr:serine/threonine-protein kinase [Vicinamibacterales bacterium]